MRGWIGVDLDGVLANTEQLGTDHSIGIPVPAMVARVQEWIGQGIEVRIFTVRAARPEQIPIVQAWCQRHIGKVLPVTNVKEPGMLQLWDDQAVAVVANTGQPRGERRAQLGITAWVQKPDPESLIVERLSYRLILEPWRVFHGFDDLPGKMASEGERHLARQARLF